MTFPFGLIVELFFFFTEYFFVILEEFWRTKFNKRPTWKLGSWDRAAEKPHNGELIQFSNAENKRSRGQTCWILTTSWDVLPPVCSPEFLIQSWGGKMAADSVQVRKLKMLSLNPLGFLWTAHIHTFYAFVLLRRFNGGYFYIDLRHIRRVSLWIIRPIGNYCQIPNGTMFPTQVFYIVSDLMPLYSLSSTLFVK